MNAAAPGAKRPPETAAPANDLASRLQALLDATPDPIVLAEPQQGADGAIVDFVCVAANKAAGALLGRTRDAMIGLRLVQHSPLQVGAELLATSCAVLAGGQSSTMTNVALIAEIPQGEQRYFDVLIATCSDGLSYTWRDVSDRHAGAKALQVLHETAVRLASVSDLQQALDVVLAAGLRIDGIDSGGIYLVDSAGGQFQLAAHAGLTPAFVKQVAAFPAGSPNARLATAGQAVYGSCHDLPLSQGEAEEGLQFVAIVPIIHDETVVAALNLGSHTRRDIAPTDRAQMEAFAAEVGGAIARIRAGEALATAKDRLETTLDSLLDPHVVLQAVHGTDGAVVDFRCVQANAAAGAYYHLTKEQLTGALHHDLFPGTAEAGLVGLYEMTLERGEPVVLDDVPYVNELLGAGRRYDVSAYRLGDELALTWRDVTDRHEAATALAASEERYRLIADNVTEVLWLMDLEARRLVYMSPSIHRQSGYTAEEATARAPGELLTKESWERMRAGVQSALAQGRGQGQVHLVLELDHVGKDGRLHPSETTLRILPAHGGQPPLLLGVSRDISERRAVEGALRRSEEHYRLLAENSNDIVFLTGLDRCAVWVAPSVTRVLGWTPEELVGTAVHDLMHPDDRRASDEARLAVYSGPKATVLGGTVLVRLRTKAGEYRWVLGEANALADEHGQVTGAVVSLRDVDELVRAREEAHVERARLRATMDSLLDPHVLLEAVRDAAGAIIDFRYIDGNEAACEYLRLSHAELVGTRLLELAPSRVAELFSSYRDVVETGEPLYRDEIAYDNARVDSGERRYDVRGVRVGDGLSVTWRDVTERYELNEALRRRVAELDVLRRVSQTLAERTELAAALADASLEIRSLFAAAHAHVFLTSAEAEAAGDTLPEADGCGCTLDEAGLTAEVLANRRPVFRAAAGGSCHVLAVPMVVRATPVGALIIARPAAAAPFDDRDLTVAQPLADALAAAVVNERLHFVETRQAARRERQQLARDLHDAVTQSMYAANLLAEALPSIWERDPLEVPQNLEALRELVRASLTEMRVLLFELYPESADTLPLEALFERLVDTFAGRTGVAVEVAVAPDLELPGEVKLVFYRVAQDALSNVGKHADAAHVKVVVDADDAEAWLTVRDDGRSFDVAAIGADRLGLRGMRERANEIGGTLDIDSTPGEGTTVSLVWSRTAVTEARDAFSGLRSLGSADYRLLAENSGDVLFVSVAGILRWVSPAVTATTGWEPEDLLGKETNHLWHPDDRDAASASRQEVEAGAIIRRTLRLHSKDGRYLWTDVSCQPYQTEDGQMGMVGTLRDASSRVDAEQALASTLQQLEDARQEAESAGQRTSAVLDSMLDPLIVLRAKRDESGAIVDLIYVDGNAAAFAYLQMTREALLGKGLLELMPGKKEAGYFGLYAGVVESGQPLVRDGIAYELEVLPGERHYFDVRAVPLGDGLVLTWRDVTERQRDALEMAASEEYLRSTLNSLMDPHLVLVPERAPDGTLVDMRCVFANTAACRAVGRSNKELASARLLTLFPRLSVSALLRICDTALGSVEPVILDDVPGHFRQQDAGHRFDIRASRLGSDVVVTWRDVTARHEAEETIRWRVSELSALQRLSETLLERADLATALQSACGLLVSVFAADSVEVRLASAAAEFAGEQPVARAGAPACAPGSAGMAAFAAAMQTADATEVAIDEGRLLVAPLIAHEEHIGALTIVRQEVYAAAELAMARTAAELLGAVIRTERLHQLATRQAAASERQRIARDLHDAVTQSIYSASLMAEALPELRQRDPEQAEREFGVVQRLIRGALAELRILLYELRPEALTTAPLETLLERLADALVGQTGVTVDVSVGPGIDLPDRVHLTFYRVAQEALNNVGKYAEASRVAVGLSADGEGVHLMVRDDGRGFDPAAPRQGMGLGIMRERAEAIGAVLAVISTPGCGTTVQLTWPKAQA